jgi:hypothetical protein
MKLGKRETGMIAQKPNEEVNMAKTWDSNWIKIKLGNERLG